MDIESNLAYYCPKKSLIIYSVKLSIEKFEVSFLEDEQNYRFKVFNKI